MFVNSPRRKIDNNAGRIRRGSSIDIDRAKEIKEKRDNHRPFRNALILAVIIGVYTWLAISKPNIIVTPSSLESDTNKYFENNVTGAGSLNGFLDVANIEKRILETTPDATEVEISHNFFLKQVDIKVKVQEPALIWQSRGVQYLLSEQGYALSTVGANEKFDFPLIIDEANVTVEIKNQIVPSDFAQFMTGLRSEAIRQSLDVERYSITASTREVRIFINETPYYVTVDSTRNAQEQITELVRLQRYFVKTGVTASEYVDLRIAGRAYWR